MKRIVAAAILLCPLLMLRGAEEAPAKLSDEDAARARKWVAQLSEAEFEVRDTAFRELQKLGPRAWPVLEPLLDAAKDAEDTETETRLRRLAKGFGILVSDQQEAVNALLAKLLDPKDGQARADALDALLDMGSAVTGLVRSQFSAKGAKLALKLEGERASAVIGQKVKFGITLVNSGDGTFWTGSGQRRSSWGTSYSKVAEFGEVRPHVPGTRTGGGRRISLRVGCGVGRGYINPMLNWKPLVPGAEEDAGTDSSKEFDELGVIELTYSRGYTTPEVAAQVPGTGEEVKLQMNADIDKDGLNPEGKLRVAVLPDLDKQQDDEKIGLNVRGDSTEARPGEKWRLTAALSFGREQGGVRVERDLARYAWYAIVDEKGGVPKYGSWRTVAGGAEAEVLAARTITPGKPAEWKLEIPAPEKPGVYSVYLGYEMTQEIGEIDGVTYPNYDEPALKQELEALKLEQKDLAYLCSGKHYARIEGLRVEGNNPGAPPGVSK